MAAPVDAVWAFLTDPRRVGPCVPGATGVEVVDDRTFRLALTVKVGFLGTTQDVEVRITEAEAPRRLVSVGRGEDRRLGSQVDVRSTVELVPLGSGETPEATEVRYRSEVKVLGRLGTIGDAVMKLKAKELGGEFAARIRAAIERAPNRTPPAESPSCEGVAPQDPPPPGGAPGGWGGGSGGGGRFRRS